MVVSWGDGSPDTPVDLIDGERSLILSHQYLDDDPTITPSDECTISVRVTDDDSEVGNESISVQVDNVAPTIDSIISSATLETKAIVDELTTVSGTFSDVGTLDTHSATIDWDEGDLRHGMRTSLLSEDRPLRPR